MSVKELTHDRANVVRVYGVDACTFIDASSAAEYLKVSGLINVATQVSELDQLVGLTETQHEEVLGSTIILSLSNSDEESLVIKKLHNIAEVFRSKNIARPMLRVLILRPKTVGEFTLSEIPDNSDLAFLTASSDELSNPSNKIYTFQNVQYNQLGPAFVSQASSGVESLLQHAISQIPAVIV